MLLNLPRRKGGFSCVWRTVVLSESTLFYAVRYKLHMLCNITFLCSYQDNILSIYKCCINHTTICNLAHTHIVGCVCIVVKRTYCLYHVPPTGRLSVRPPVRLSANITATPTGRISVKLEILGLTWKSVGKNKIWLQWSKISITVW